MYESDNLPCYVSSKVNDHWRDEVRIYVCKTLRTYKCPNDNRNYCLLHFPGDDKDVAEFEDIIQKRIEAVKTNLEKIKNPQQLEVTLEKGQLTYDFREICFPSEFKFNNKNFDAFVNFNGAVFLGDVYFNGATFNATATFDSTYFKGIASFRRIHVTKNAELMFIQTHFESGVDFQFAIFAGYVAFEGTKSAQIFIGKKDRIDSEAESSPESVYQIFVGEKTFLNLQKLRVEDPERVSFHTVKLHPNWFINVDPRKFIFTDVYWENVDNIFTTSNIYNELENISDRKVENSKQLLKITYRQLAENSEINNRFEEASNFRRMAMETEWLEKKEMLGNWINSLDEENEKTKNRLGGSTEDKDVSTPPSDIFGVFRRSGDFIIHGLYRISSFYGESGTWAASILLIIVFLIFPLIYTQVEFQLCPSDRPVILSVPENKCRKELVPLWDGEAILESVSTATFQTVEYRKPTTGWGEFWVILEKIFAPLQFTLLALAVRRKFMR